MRPGGRSPYRPDGWGGRSGTLNKGSGEGWPGIHRKSETTGPDLVRSFGMGIPRDLGNRVNVIALLSAGFVEKMADRVSTALRTKCRTCHIGLATDSHDPVMTAFVRYPPRSKLPINRVVSDLPTIRASERSRSFRVSALAAWGLFRLAPISSYLEVLQTPLAVGSPVGG